VTGSRPARPRASGSVLVVVAPADGRDDPAAGARGHAAGAAPRGDAASYNAAVDLLERNLEPGRGDRPYLRTAKGTMTYAAVSAAADSAGAGLLDLGLVAEDRVVLATRDRPEFVAAFWGSIKAGLVAVPVTPDLSASDFAFILQDSGARAVICDPASAAALMPVARSTTTLFVGDDRPDGMLSWSDHCGEVSALAPAVTSPDQIALWLYTSGTTGQPKASMHRHRSLRDAPRALAQQVVGLGSDDIVLSVSKMFFAYGLGNSVYLPAATGASVVVNEGPAVPARIQGLLAMHRPTVLYGVPAFYRGYLELGDADPPDTVRVAISAGETLRAALFDGLQRRFGLAVLDGLGATEALHHFTSNRPDDFVPGSAGPPLDGYQVRVLDRSGRRTPDGEAGELWVKGPTTFAGYWRRPGLTERAYRGPWMRTGDLVHLREGRVYHEGRLDDLIKLGGIWVAPSEIEAVLCEHPDVADAAVVARDDPRGVSGFTAFVLSDRSDRSLISELLGLCRTRLARFKVPSDVRVVDELPRTPTGKVRRFMLRGQPRDATSG
jgi:benzoate-CoA ligase family protein